MIEAMLMVRRKGSTKVEGMGRKQFVVLPRIGDGVELNIDGKGILFRVVGFHHPGEPANSAGDIYAFEEGPTAEVVRELFNR